MHICEVRLEGFRGAKSLTLQLHKNLNLFVGVNGAGKSSVLDATAILLSWLANRIRTVNAPGRRITESDINNGEKLAGLVIVVGGNGWHKGWSLKKVRRGYSNRFVFSFLNGASEVAEKMRLEVTANKGRANLPLFAHYPVNRAVLDIPLRVRAKHRFDLLSAYDQSLTSGANFRTFFEWFREREDLENEARRDQQAVLFDAAMPRFPDPQLEAIRNALTHFLPGYSNLTVRRNPLRMEIEKNGERVTVNQLSDGEKCLMAMIGDVARRLAIANPLRENPLHGEGIILIDEIDLHLHPKWQRTVINKLPEVFPNCQLLLSTHSPSIVTHVQPENLFLLSMDSGELRATRPSESYGKTVDRVLEDLMGLETTRPITVKEAISEIFQLIHNGNLKEAKEHINRMKAKIHDDSDLIKADVLIRRKELIGK